jgi:hypothetical protein
MKLKQWERLLLVLLSSLGGGVCAITSPAAEQVLPPLACSLLDRTADPIHAVGLSQIPQATMVTPVPIHIPVEEADVDERPAQALKAVPGMMISGTRHDASDFALAPAGSLGPAGMLPAIQSPMLSPAELANKGSAVVGCPQQSGMKLERDCGEAAADGPPPTYPHR